MKKCPKCGHEEFIVSAHVVQDWLVDKYGTFEKEICACTDVAHFPDDDDLWTCDKCGYEAEGSKFNI